MVTFYKLVNKTPVKITTADLLKNPSILDIKNRRVKKTILGSMLISTVFLYHTFEKNDNKPPRLFETMIYSNQVENNNKLIYRYFTWNDAVYGHNQLVNILLTHNFKILDMDFFKKMK